MKRLKFIFLYLSFGLSFLNSRGQQIANYVSNGGFEENYGCADAYLENGKGWDEIDANKACKYCHYCFPTVPYNGFGFQYPRSGSAYVIADFYCLACGPNIRRTNIRNRLRAGLVANKQYCVKINVNIGNYSTYGIDGIGAYFGDQSIDTIKRSHIVLNYLSPQIKIANGNIVVDTLGWTTISGTFTAKGSEVYVIIGNFNSDANTSRTLLNAAALGSFCTVSVDDVSCIPVDLPAYAGPDKGCIFGDSVFIGRQSDVGIDEACLWFKLPNSTIPINTVAGLWVKAITTTTYVVRQEICGNVKWDTVVIYKDAVGFEKLQWFADNITLFPNPTTEYLNISFSGTAPPDFTSYFITDNLGQNIREEDLHGSSISVSTADLASGLYQIHLRTPFGTVTKKFVKAD